MSKLLEAITPSWLKIGAIAVLGLVIFLGYRHYTGLLEQLETSQAAVANLTQLWDAAIDQANANAAAAKRADEERKVAVDALEAAQAEPLDNIAKSKAAEDVINAASDDQDGPVAPVLEQLRKSRFGGAK